MILNFYAEKIQFLLDKINLNYILFTTSDLGI